MNEKLLIRLFVESDAGEQAPLHLIGAAKQKASC